MADEREEEALGTAARSYRFIRQMSLPDQGVVRGRLLLVEQ